jgi:iron complex outermembrane receptor protein
MAKMRSGAKLNGSALLTSGGRSALLAATFLSTLALSGGEAAAQTVEEVIVTAQKRSQAINDVGLTVTALDAETLRAQKITTLADVARAVPGLDFAPSNNNTPVLTLRGIGFYESSLSAYPAVSVYLDEVPLALPILSTHTAFDLQRIEVLKGPQGTLFGQNSTGGAINYIAARPTEEFAGGADLTYGRFNTLETNAFVSGRLAPTLKGRAAVHVLHGDDWQKSYTRNDKVGEAAVYAGRLLLDFEPAERVRFSLNVNGWVDKSDPAAPQYIAPFPQQTCCALPAVVAYPVSPSRPRAADWSPNSRPRAHNELLQVALRSDFDITQDVTLTALTSYVDFNLDQVPEGDGTFFNILDVRTHQGSIESFTQELRIANAGSARLRWVVGGNYDQTKARETFVNDFSQSSTPGALGIIAGGVFGEQRMKTYAVFGNAEYDVMPALTLKAGARYTKAKRKSENCGFDAGDGATNGFFTFLSGLLSGTAVPALRPGDCFNMDANFRNGPPFFGELTEDNVSWRVGVDYKPSRDLLLYANVAKGFKGGSFPVLGAATNAQYRPVTQESVLSYEAGVKATVAPWLQVNAAAFYYDYKDKQLKSKLIDPVFGVLDVLVNVPKTKLKGAELEVTANPVEGLTLQGAVSYIDAEITEYMGVNNAGVLDDFAGTRVPYTPKWTGRLNLDYERPVGGLVAFAGTSLSFKSSSVAIVGGDQAVINGRSNLYRLNSYALLDVRAGVASPDDKWRLTVFGRNITDEFYILNASTASDAIVRYVGRPATWGVTFGYRF